MAALLACCAVVGLMAFAWHNLSYAGFWWDEAAQFWIAQGLSNYAEPHAVPAGLGEVYRLNMEQNLDPGGFTLIEHFWTLASRQVAWIRALPLSFLVVALAAAAMLGRMLSRSWLIAAAGFSMPLLYSRIPYFGLENRAYSMEMAGIVGGLVLLLLAMRKLTWWSFLLLGMYCAAFLSSRYSYIYFVACLFLALVFFKPGGSGAASTRYYLNTALCALPIALSALTIYFLMLSDQLWPEMRGTTALGISAPVYTQGSVLKDTPDLSSLVWRNTLSLDAVPITTAIVYYLFVRRWLHNWLRKQSDSGVDQTVATGVSVVLFFVLCYQCVSILFSGLGYYPWDIGSRWNAGLLMVSAVAALALTAEANNLVRSSRIAGSGRWREPGPAVAVIVSMAALFHTAGYRLSRETPWVSVPDQLERLYEEDGWPANTYVTFYEVPVVRYLYEYGPMRMRTEYPRAFRFETGEEYGSKSPIDAAGENIHFIITAEISRTLGKRIAGRSLEPLGKRHPAPFLVIGGGS